MRIIVRLKAILKLEPPSPIAIPDLIKFLTLKLLKLTLEVTLGVYEMLDKNFVQLALFSTKLSAWLIPFYRNLKVTVDWVGEFFFGPDEILNLLI